MFHVLETPLEAVCEAATVCCLAVVVAADAEQNTKIRTGHSIVCFWVCVHQRVRPSVRSILRRDGWLLSSIIV